MTYVLYSKSLNSHEAFCEKLTEIQLVQLLYSSFEMMNISEDAAQVFMCGMKHCFDSLWCFF